jgi:UDP:flavonoid glycosyltransferase YjiC (YdhE family)
MKIVLISYGLEGDIRPFQALAKTLQNAGHCVRMCSHDIFAERFQQVGINFVSVGEPFDHGYYNETFDQLCKMGDPVESLVYFTKRTLLTAPKRWFEDCLQAIAGWDLAIIHQFDIPGQEAAIRLQIPWVAVCLCPGEIKTAYEPPSGFPNICKLTNRLLWAYVNNQYSRTYDRLINEFISSIGGKLRTNIALESTYSRDLTLIAASPALCTAYPDRPSYFKFTGNWELRDEQFEPSDELQQFLAEGPLPVVVSFSSMGGSLGTETARIILDVLEELGVRAIVQRGWMNLVSDSPRSGIFSAPFIPHHYLFKHATLVIHHGGAGTTHMACKSGVPSLVVPFLADQFYWGGIVYAKGLGPMMIPRKGLTHSLLRERLQEGLSNQLYKLRAQAIAEQMCVEDGLKLAVKYVEAFALQALGRRQR